jgi:hypothetical protein
MVVQVTRLIPPTDWVNRQINGLKANGQANYVQGIQKPKKDTIQAGIAGEAKYANMVQQAIQNGTRAKHLANVTLQEWETNAETIGAPRLVDGVVRRQYKVNNFVTSFSPLLLNLLSSVDQMPTGTANERDQKSQAMIQGLRALRGTW